MRNERSVLFAAAALLGLASVCVADQADEQESFPPGIILVGAKTTDDPKTSTIQVMSPAGDNIQRLFRRAEGSMFLGRLSPAGDRLAFGFVSPDGKQSLWILDASGEARKIAEGGGGIT